MAQCPVCNSRLMVGRRFPFKKQFSCPACGWKMDVDEVHKRGGIDRIASDSFHKRR